MRVALITPWQNAWVPYYENAFKARGHEFGVFERQAPIDSDVVLHGWAIGTPSVAKARNVVCLRRYELFDGGLPRINWEHTHALVCVNSWIKSMAEQILAENKVSCPVHLVYNGLDTARWKYRERRHGKKIGMACFIHSKKNIPLALQILNALPDDYELHIAGDIQDAAVAEYLNHLANAMQRKLYVYGQVPANKLDAWWDMMDYCLSTSVSEGNPNNVIEAMAKGIKPIVHRWPGSEDQFEGHIFSSVAEAVQLIQGSDYDSAAYRKTVEDRYSLANIEKVVALALNEV